MMVFPGSAIKPFFSSHGVFYDPRRSVSASRTRTSTRSQATANASARAAALAAIAGATSTSVVVTAGVSSTVRTPHTTTVTIPERTVTGTETVSQGGSGDSTINQGRANSEAASNAEDRLYDRYPDVTNVRTSSEAEASRTLYKYSADFSFVRTSDGRVTNSGSGSRSSRVSASAARASFIVWVTDRTPSGHHTVFSNEESTSTFTYIASATATGTVTTTTTIPESTSTTTTYTTVTTYRATAIAKGTVST